MKASLLWMPLLLALPAAAQPFTCTSNTGVVPLARAESKAERVADIVVSCTGGFPTGEGQSISLANFTLSFNANVTSRIMAPGNRVEALALLDEPPPGSQFPCATSPCPSTGNGIGSGYYGPYDPAQELYGNSNVFDGVVGTGSQANTITFTLPLDPPGSRTRIIRFTNIRLDPSSAGSSTLQLLGIAVVGQVPFTSIGTVQAVAFVQAGLATTVRNGTSAAAAPAGVNVALAVGGQATATRAATIRFSPTFIGATRTRTIGGAASVDAPGPPAAQDGPGVFYNSESGFYNPAFPVTALGANLGQAGLADWGTRLKATFGNLPANVTVYVSLRTDGTAITNAPAARLISTDAAGAGAFSAIAGDGTISLLTPSSGAATAVWEVLGNSFGTNNFDLGIWVAYPPGITSAPGPVTVKLGYAPLQGGIPAFLDAAASPVLFTFTATAPPMISVLPASLAFSGTAGGQNPQAQSITVTGTPGTVSYSATSGSVLPLLLSPSAGQTPGTTSVTVVTQGLAAGTYRDSLTVSGPQNSVPVAITLTLAPAPLITGLDPPTVVAGSALTLNVSGANFTPGTTVTWNGSQLATTFRSAGLLTAQVSPALVANVGSASITAVTPDGAVSNSVVFRIVAPPTITVLPGSLAFSGTAGGQNPPAQSITVTGTPGTVSYSATSGSVLPLLLSPAAGQTPGTTLVTVATQGLAAGTYRDNLTVSGPQNSVPVAITLTLAPAPLITGLDPATGVVGSALTLNVSGANFTPGTTVTWNGSQVATTFRSAGLLTAQVSAALVANEGLASITAVTTDGAVSNSVAFRVVPRPPPPPTLSVSPGSMAFFGTAGGQNPPAQSITVTGTPDSVSYSMTGGSVLPLSLVPPSGQTPGTTAVTVLTRGLAAGIYRDTITVLGPQSTSTVAITLTLAPGPRITALDPASTVAGSPAFVLNVIGSNFVAGTTVSWNGSPLSTNFVNNGQLTAQVPAALVATAGEASVTAVTADGTVSNAVPFGIVPLVLSSISPASVLAGGPSFTLTATGTGFLPGATLNVGGASAAILTRSATQITATIAASAIAQPGTLAVSVTNPGGMTSNSLNLAVTESLTLTRISPDTVTATRPAFALTLTGTGFAAGASVQIGGATFQPSSVSRAQITVNVPASVVAEPGSLAVSVVQGTASAGPLTLTVRPAPRITALSPSTVTAGSPAFTLAVSGTNLTSGLTVLWNGQSLTTTFAGGVLSAQVAAELVAAAGTASISVVTEDGVSSNSLPFTITPAASISALSPSTANAGSPAFTLTVTGANFVQGAQVAWNGQALPTTFGSATQLTAQVAAGLVAAVGTATVTVNSPGGAVSNGLPFTIVLPPLTNVGFTAPANAPSGQDQTITLTLGGTYPVDLRGTLTLTFAPDGTLPDDPAIQLQNGSRTLTFTVPAGAPAQSPTVVVKTGTVAGVITITLTFATTSGQNVTATGVTPQRITVARAAPGISSVTCARNTSGFTVTIDGFTNTREATQATFDFTAASGASLGTTQLALQTGSLFSAWFGSSSASGVGGVFRYTQPFTVQGSATSIASLTVRLGNSVGTSAAGSCQLQ